jgi:hypothetical protein
MLFILPFILLVGVIAYTFLFPTQYQAIPNITDASAKGESASSTNINIPPPKPTLNKVDYDKRVLALANNPAPPAAATTSATSTATSTATTTPVKTPNYIWPAKGNPYPDVGAILPFHRIVAYYGNYYSKGMGVLGEYDEGTTIAKLRSEVAKWNIADPNTPVMPAIEYIAVTAQGSPGPDGNYNLRMPDGQIDHAIEMAKRVNGIVILDVQPGTGNLQTEIHLLEPYLKLPQVHLAIDPEFNMKLGRKPGMYIGTVDAADINAAAKYLAQIVKENNLPPKVLVVHRFTYAMVTGAEEIKPLPQVQIVMDMDGWGSPAKKKNTYKRVIYSEPVQFTGLKLFYKNDLLPPSTRLMTTNEILNLRPIPIYIQYQ